MLLGGEGALCLGHASAKLRALPPSWESPHCLVMEAADEPNEEIALFIKHFNS